MTVFVTTTEPTPAQIATSNAEMIEGSLVGMPGRFCISIDDNLEIPEWLSGSERINVPAQTHACPRCGYSFDNESEGADG